MFRTPACQMVSCWTTISQRLVSRTYRIVDLDILSPFLYLLRLLVDLFQELIGQDVELVVGDLGGNKIRGSGLALGGAGVLSIGHQAGGPGGTERKAP